MVELLSQHHRVKVRTQGLCLQYTSFPLKLKSGPIQLVLHNNWPGKLASNKHSSLLGPFISYEEK
jgi:hypothetical protein